MDLCQALKYLGITVLISMSAVSFALFKFQEKNPNLFIIILIIALLFFIISAVIICLKLEQRND